jgi:hypothetical protein
MKRKLVILAVTSTLAFSCFLTGCDRTVSMEESSEVNRDGSVERERETVTQHPDGTVTKREEKTETEPVNP